MPSSNIIKIYKQISNNLNNPNFKLSLEHQQTLFAYFYHNFAHLKSLEKSMLDVIITFIINYKKEICPEGKKLFYHHIMYMACTKNKLSPITINYIESDKIGEFNFESPCLNLSNLFLQYDLHGHELTTLFPEISFLKNTNNLLIIMFIINHLTEHYHQYADQQSNQVNEEAFLYTKYSLSPKAPSTSPFCNISHPELESYANSRAINNTLEYLAQYQYANKKHIDYLYQEWLQLNNYTLITSNANIYSDITQLLNAIQSNPSLLNTNQLLNYFFQKDQSSNITLKPLDTLVNEYNQLRATNSNIVAHQKEAIYRHFILYIIIKQDYQINAEESENYTRIIYEITRDFLNSLALPTSNQETAINAINSKLSIAIKLLKLLKSIDKENKHLPKCQFFIKEFLDKYNSTTIDNLELTNLIAELTAIDLPDAPPPLNSKPKKTLKF